MHACMYAEFYVWFVSIYKDIDTEKSVVKQAVWKHIIRLYC